MNGFILQIIIIAIGVIVLCLAVAMLARKRLEANACVTWGFISITMIIAGIVLRPTGWSNYISLTGLILIIVIGVCFLLGLLIMSISLSGEVRKSNELIMQVSILNYEIDDLQKQIDKLEKKLEAASLSEKG